MKKAAHVYLIVITILVLLIAMVISTLAWFSANHLLYTDTVTLTASDSLQMHLSIPSTQSNGDSYMGQTGLQYEGIDAPYRLEYYPVALEIDLQSDEEYYMVCEITEVKIQKVIEGEPEILLETSEIVDNFTWRFGIRHYENGQLVEKLYKNNNGFLYDEQSGQPFRVIDDMSYNFTYYLYFLGEEGLSLMQQTISNIPERYRFDYCDLTYMWSTFYISINIGIRELHKINFNTMGGDQCESIPTTGAASVLLPIPTTSDNTKYFGGWYLTPTYEGEPFEEDSLIKNPQKSDVTLYAKWLDKPSLSFDMQGSSQPQIATQYLMPGEVPVNPGANGEIVAWTTTPMNYNEYLSNPQPFDFDAPLTENTTVYAVRLWHLITLHMDTNYGGYLIVDGTTYEDTYTFYVYDGDKIPNIYFPKPNMSIREFKKWSLEDDAVTYIDASNYNFNTVIHSAVHLYAYYGL